jgi:hypothetical protein
MNKPRKCLILLPLCCLLFISSSGLKFRTVYNSQTDPSFVFRKGMTIGLVPDSWTSKAKAAGKDALMEKVLLDYIRQELVRRGAEVDFIPVEHLKEQEDGNIACVDMDKYPDLTIICAFGAQNGEVQVPSQTAAYLGQSGGILGSTGAYTATFWGLFIRCSLWSGASEYRQVVWRGEISKGSAMPNLSEHAKGMVQDLFKKKFLKN